MSAVASAVLYDNITWFERDFRTFIEFETNNSITNNVVVHRCCAGASLVRRGPPMGRKRGTDRLAELTDGVPISAI
jgi:hypothetical protein